jgi:hypothetical protein
MSVTINARQSLVTLKSDGQVKVTGILNGTPTLSILGGNITNIAIYSPKSITIGTSNADYVVSAGSNITNILQTIIDTYKSASVFFKSDNGANVTYLWGSNLLRNPNGKLKIELANGVTLKRIDNLNFPCLTSRSTPKGVNPVWVTQDYLELTGGTFDFNSDNQSEKDWVGVDLSHFNAEQSFGSSASKNYLTGQTKGVTNFAHGLLNVHDTKIINSGFNNFGVGSGRPAGTGQGAIFFRDGQRFIWNNVVTDNTDAPFSLSRVDIAVADISINTNYNFDGGYAALCGYVYFSNFKNRGQGTPLALYNNYYVEATNIDHQALIYTVTQVIDNSNFIIDCELNDTDRLKGKRVVFPYTQSFTEMGYDIVQTSANTGVKYEITAYNGTTKQVTIDTPTVNAIKVGDKLVVSTDGLKVSLESGLTLESEFARLVNVTVRGINSVDPISKAGIVIDTGTKKVELENVKSLGSFEHGVFVGNIPNLVAKNLEVNGSGLSGVVDNAVGAIYDIPKLKNNGLRQTGDSDGIRLNQPNTIIINPQITDTRASGFKTQQKAIRGFGGANNIFIYGGNVAGNADNFAITLPISSDNSIIAVGGVNGERPVEQTLTENTIIPTPGTNSLTLNRQNGNPQAITLTCNVTQLKLRPGQQKGTTFKIIFKQDGVGGRIISSYDTVPVSGVTGNAPIKWAGDPFVLSTTPNAVDTLELRWGEDGVNWYEINRNKSTSNFPYSNLQVDDKFILKQERTIASSGSTGIQGEICHDDNYIYVCVGTNSWKRTPILTTF